MRVLEVIASGDVGGGTTHVLQILRGLKNDISPYLLTQRDSYLFKKAGEAGIPCFGLDFFSSRLNPRVLVGFRKILQSVKPHVVHVHGGRAAFFFALARSAVPCIYTVHGFHFVYKPLPFRWLAIAAERLALHRANHVIFVSQFDKNLANTHRLLSRKTTHCIIHNGVSRPSVMAGAQNQQRLIGFVGRLEPQKDPLLFVNSMRELPGYRALLIGAGSLEMTVRKEIERQRLGDRVTMLVGLSHEETMKAMINLQLLVMTSRWEGLPLVPLEAMRIGVPVVATDVGGMSEIIEDGTSGILVSERTSTAIALAVKLVCEDESLRTKLVDEGRARANKKFSEEAMLFQVQALYEKMRHHRHFASFFSRIGSCER